MKLRAKVATNGRVGTALSYFKTFSYSVQQFINNFTNMKALIGQKSSYILITKHPYAPTIFVVYTLNTVIHCLLQTKLFKYYL